MKRTVSKWLSILSCTALLCTSIPAAFAEGTVEESLVPVTGAQTGFVLSQGKYYTDFANLAQERAAAKALNIQLGEEGFVLLKNDGVLPLDSATTKVSMFGFRAANIMMGGGGSGSGRPGQYGVPKTSLEDGMKQAGFDVNERLLSFYSTKSAEVKPTDIPDSIAYTYDAYSDAALVVVSRSGSEGRDEVTYGYAQNENADPNAHMLELTDTEKDLIRYVKANFPKVILIVNSSNAMELAEVNASKTEDNLGVDAILWVGHTGNDGAAAIGNILSGKVSPSGRTADTYAVDFTKDPTFTNFGSNGQNFENGERMNNNVYVGDTMTDYHSVEYREGIYVGYRYYETKGHDAGEAWYDENVVYPFGYGLSYTTFTQEIEGDIAPTGVIHAANETITVKVRVTNTGDVAGNYRYNYGGLITLSPTVPTKPDIDPHNPSNLDGSGSWTSNMGNHGVPGVERVAGFASAELPFFKVEAGQVSHYGTYDVAADPDKVRLEPTGKRLPEPNQPKTQYREYTKALTTTDGTGMFRMVYDGSTFNITPVDDGALALMRMGDVKNNVELSAEALHAGFSEMGILLEDLDGVYVHFDTMA